MPSEHLREPAPPANSTAHFPTVRLAAAAYGSLVLLVWIGFVPGALPLVFRSASGSPGRMFITTNLALLLLILLGPILWRGPGRMRWLALLLTLFPTLVFGVTALWYWRWILFR